MKEEDISLSAAERAKIRLEEEYRLEVRREAEARAPTGKKGKVLEFLNSQFGIWFLTSVLLTGVSTLWGYWYKQYEAGGAQRAKIAAIYLEIGQRVANAREKLEVTIAGQTDAAGALGEQSENLLTLIDGPATTGAASANNDLRAKTFKRLLIELKAGGSKADTRNVTKLDTAYQSLASDLKKPSDPGKVRRDLDSADAAIKQ